MGVLGALCAAAQAAEEGQKNIPEESKFQLTEFTLLPSGVCRLTMLIPSALKSRIICNSLQIKAFPPGSQRTPVLLSLALPSQQSWG